MTAKEMFEKLGYVDTSKEYHNLIRYVKKEKIGEKIICIELGSNEIQFARYWDTEGYGTFHCTKEELQAINKQIEELGWKLNTEKILKGSEE